MGNSHASVTGFSDHTFLPCYKNLQARMLRAAPH